jgi:mono/diheme cytochrome c family protein
MGQDRKRQHAGRQDASRRQAGRLSFSIAGATALAVVACAAQAATPDAETLQRGEALLTKNCAVCHAVGTSGDSPRAGAPVFRTLGQKYPIESLEEALGEGIVSGHPDMPEFRFEADDVGAIIAYLKSIQQR